MQKILYPEMTSIPLMDFEAAKSKKDITDKNSLEPTNTKKAIALPEILYSLNP